jgi:hypothetical protein
MPCNRLPNPGPFVRDQAFSNWAENVALTPQQTFSPTTIDELVAIVRTAEQAGMSVHAVGSGWSFADIMTSPDVMVLTKGLDQLLSETMSGRAYPNDSVFGALTPQARQRNLAHVQAGIKIHCLYTLLEQVPGGPILHDGPGGAPVQHGFAPWTLGGSGGQSIVGALATSTHGGDMPVPPLPDMVQGVHIVGPGGAEYFVQRTGADAVVTASALAGLEPCLAGRIITDDDVLNSVVVAAGRMGFIYSVVLKVVPQYILLQTTTKDSWENVSTLSQLGQHSASGNTIADLRPMHRFLQVLVMPYRDGTGNHPCFVSVRDLSDGPPKGQPGFNAFNFACDLTPPEQVAFVAGIVTTLTLSAGTLSAIPIIGPFLVAADIAAITLLSPLLNPGVTIGDYLAAAMNLATRVGMIGLAQSIVDSVLGSFMSLNPHQDLSFKVMDTYDYAADCYKALSLEVGFDADATQFVDFVNEVIGIIDSLTAENVLVGAYISLRFCGGSDALLALEQWPNTVCIEISSLAGLSGDATALSLFENAAANLGATVHWGQLNHRTRAEVEAAFPRINTWRTTLARLSSAGLLSTFDNDFCMSHGLETCGATWRPPDLSFPASLLTEDEPGSLAAVSAATLLLLTDEDRGEDVSYLAPLLLN